MILSPARLRKPTQDLQDAGTRQLYLEGKMTVEVTFKVVHAALEDFNSILIKSFPNLFHFLHEQSPVVSK